MKNGHIKSSIVLLAVALWAHSATYGQFVVFELESPQKTWHLGENPILNLRVTNHTAWPVKVVDPVSGIGGYEIHLRLADDREGLIRAPDHPTVRDMHWVSLEPGRSLERSVWLDPQFSVDRLEMPPGEVRVEFRPVVGPFRADPQAGAEPRVSSEAKPLTLVYRTPTEAEQQVIDLLWHSREDLSTPRARVAHYERFLQRLPEGSLADEVRYALLDEFSHAADDARDSSYWQAHQSLIESCVTALLDRGGPYDRGWTDWNAERGGNVLLRLAAQNHDADLTRTLIQHMNAASPDDADGAAYRAVIAAYASGSNNEVRAAAADYARRFPNGAYARSVEATVKAVARSSPEATPAP